MADTLTVRLPKQLQNRLHAVSRDEKIPVSDLVRQSLDRFLAIRQFRRLRSKALPFAESQGLLTDEDIFKKIS